MKIETKYNNHDEVWGMLDNKPKKFIITAFEVRCEYIGGANDFWGSKSFPIIIIYYLSGIDKNIAPMDESKLFSTKEELINSL